MQLSTLRRGLHPSAILLLLMSGVLAIAGCKVDKVTFNRIEEGKKFLSADQPFQALEYFEESLTRNQEKDRQPEAHAYLLVAYDRAAKKVGENHPDAAKYNQKRDAQAKVVAGDRASLDTLVAILSQHDLASQSAASLLVSLGSPATPSLLETYGQNSELSGQILDILEHIGSDAGPEVAKAIDGGSLQPANHLRLIRLLGSIDGPASQETLARLAQDSSQSESSQVEAAAALYRLGDKSHRDRLIAALDSADVDARRAASNVAVHLNESPSTSVLLPHLSDTDAAVRLGLVKALGKHGKDASVMASLIGVLRKDADTEVANEAGRSLTTFGSAAVVPVLDALTTERDWPRRQRLVQVLKSAEVRPGFNQDLEYKLYEYYDKKETHPEVKRDLALLLKELEN